MSVASSAPLPIPPATAPHPVVAIIAENDLFDAALVALVDCLGFDVVLLDLDVEPPAITAEQHPVASIVRSGRRIPQLRSRPHLRTSAVIAIGELDVRDGHVRPDVRISARCSADDLRAVLSPLLPSAHQAAAPPVHVTKRELEVLTTYIMGATMNDTAKQYFIAESTVRAHYRRVSDRYSDAGRKVGNKAQLLLALIADGLISPTDLLEGPGPASTSVLHAVPSAQRSR